VDSKITNYYYPETEMAVLVQVGVHYSSDWIFFKPHGKPSLLSLFRFYRKAGIIGKYCSNAYHDSIRCGP